MYLAQGNGLAAHFGKRLYCLAAEPRETILRIAIMDGDTEVAYETAVVGALRKGYRCFQLRDPRTGSRIAMCSLLVVSWPSVRTTYHLPVWNHSLCAVS